MIATVASVVAQALILRRQLNGLELGSLIEERRGSRWPRCSGWSRLVDLVAARVGASARASALRSSPSAAASLAAPLVYLAVVLALGVPEARQLSGWSAGGPRYPIWGRFRGADEPDVRQSFL